MEKKFQCREIIGRNLWVVVGAMMAHTLRTRQVISRTGVRVPAACNSLFLCSLANVSIFNRPHLKTNTMRARLVILRTGVRNPAATKSVIFLHSLANLSIY
jgi:hypothetical protein